MGVYFFSRHKPDPKMIQDLGGSITTQIKGTISGIRRVTGQTKGTITENCPIDGNTITFSETILAENTDAAQEIWHHTISANSIVVAVAPLTLQVQWLDAGIKTLLIPQTTREVVDGKTIFSYTGLVRIKGITIDKEQWSGLSPTIEQKHAQRSLLHKIDN